MADSDVGHRDEERFVASLRRLREERGWSQSELATKMREQGWASFRQTTISRLEKGEQSVRIGEARALAQLLGVSVDAMLAPSQEAHLVDPPRDDLERERRAIPAAILGLEELEASRMAMRGHLAQVSEQFGEQLASGVHPEDPTHLRILSSLIRECEGWLATRSLAKTRTGRRWSCSRLFGEQEEKGSRRGVVTESGGSR